MVAIFLLQDKFGSIEEFEIKRHDLVYPVGFKITAEKEISWAAKRGNLAALAMTLILGGDYIRQTIRKKLH